MNLFQIPQGNSLLYQVALTECEFAMLKTNVIKDFPDEICYCGEQSGIQPENHEQSGIQQQSDRHSGIQQQSHGHSCAQQQSDRHFGIQQKVTDILVCNRKTMDILVFNNKVTDSLMFSSKVTDILVFSSKFTDILVRNLKTMDILVFSNKVTDIPVFSSKVTDILASSMKVTDIPVFNRKTMDVLVFSSKVKDILVFYHKTMGIPVFTSKTTTSLVFTFKYHRDSLSLHLEHFGYTYSFCPTQVSTCYGCGASVKPGRRIPEPPYDLVIISNMMREYRKDGQVLRKQANVYFHCERQCISRRQPYFVSSLCSIPPVIRMSLTNHHHEFLKSFGTSI